MGARVQIPNAVVNDRAADRVGPRLQGTWQRAAVAVYIVLFLVSLVCAILSITCLNIWDRTPAAELPQVFSWVDQESIAQRTVFQNGITGLGFSLAGWADLLSAFRLLGSLPLFLLSVFLVRKSPHRLMAILFAIVLAVMGAAGMWNNPMFVWAGGLVEWMAGVGQMLNLLLWFGLIFLYSFPNAHFVPRWTVWLIIPLFLIVIPSAFDLQIFLNPGTWPPVLALLPNVVFIGVAYFSVLYRYRQADPDQKDRLQGFVWGVSLLMILYFILFFLTEGYGAITGQDLFPAGQPQVLYVLISEPLWFTLEIVFAWLTYRSIFRKDLLVDN